MRLESEGTGEGNGRDREKEIAHARAASDVYENAWEFAHRNVAFSSLSLFLSSFFSLAGDFIYRISMKSTGQRLLSDNPLLPDKL